MSSKSKKPNKELIELDEFLSNLTEVELETSSKTIFSLCETARNVELFKTERAVMDSFLEWARSENGKHQSGTDKMDRTPTKEIEPNQIAPINEVEPGQPLTFGCAEYTIGVDLSNDRDYQVEIEYSPAQAIINEIKTLLDGIDYRSVLDPVAVALAKNNGIVILYGASDDLLELEGVIDDEVGAYNGLNYRDILDDDGLSTEVRDLLEWHQIELVWSDEAYEPSWSFKVDERSRFERFKIMEDGEVFSEGIILSVMSKEV